MGFSQQQLPGTGVQGQEGNVPHASLVIVLNPHVWDSQLKDAGTRARELPSTSNNER